MLTKIESACANTILNHFLQMGDCITHMKLQKILYFSVARCLVENNRYIVEHDFQAWPHGPVLPELYKVLKGYRDRVITELIEHEEKKYVYSEGDTFKSILETIDLLKCFTAWELSEKSHATDGPWFNCGQYKKKDIIVSLIKI